MYLKPHECIIVSIQAGRLHRSPLSFSCWVAVKYQGLGKFPGSSKRSLSITRGGKKKKKTTVLILVSHPVLVRWCFTEGKLRLILPLILKLYCFLHCDRRCVCMFGMIQQQAWKHRAPRDPAFPKKPVHGTRCWNQEWWVWVCVCVCWGFD